MTESVVKDREAQANSFVGSADVGRLEGEM
jgi:hypothetical protein